MQRRHPADVQRRLRGDPAAVDAGLYYNRGLPEECRDARDKGGVRQGRRQVCWRAAQRGEDAVVEARVSAHVQDDFSLRAHPTYRAVCNDYVCIL